VERLEEISVDFPLDEAHGLALRCLWSPHLSGRDGTVQQIDGRHGGIENAGCNGVHEWESFAKNRHVPNELVSSNLGPE